jgi:hypothetical protein
MTVRNPEYDRFGPWVIEISAEDPPPSLFEPHLTRSEAPLLAVKIPRKIARRDAHPGMHLYDYVVSLYERDLQVLQRQGQDVRAVTIAYRDVQHLRVREDLLRGNLHLALPDAPFDLPYNTVSHQLMQRLVRLLQERSLPPGWPALGPLSAAPIEPLSFYFEGLLRAVREAEPAMRPIAAQADATLGSSGSSWLRRAVFGLVDKRLLESLHQTDGEVLRVLDRGRPYAYRWQTVYGREESWIPLANIRQASWDDDPGGVTRTLTIGTPGGERRWVFRRDNATVEPYAALLGRLLDRSQPARFGASQRSASSVDQPLRRA